MPILLKNSISGLSSLPVAVSVCGRVHRDDLGSGEDLLIDDVGEPDNVQHGQRRDGEPHYPLTASRALLGDPAAYWRQLDRPQAWQLAARLALWLALCLGAPLA